MSVSPCSSGPSVLRVQGSKDRADRADRVVFVVFVCYDVAIRLYEKRDYLNGALRPFMVKQFTPMVRTVAF